MKAESQELCPAGTELRRMQELRFLRTRREMDRAQKVAVYHVEVGVWECLVLSLRQLGKDT